MFVHVCLRVWLCVFLCLCVCVRERECVWLSVCTYISIRIINICTCVSNIHTDHNAQGACSDSSVRVYGLWVRESYVVCKSRVVRNIHTDHNEQGTCSDSTAGRRRSSERQRHFQFLAIRSGAAASRRSATSRCAMYVCVCFGVCGCVCLCMSACVCLCANICIHWLRL